MKYPPILPAVCASCSKVIFRRRTKSGRNYCDTRCKADWQRAQKPVTKEWLIEHYIEKRMDCTTISKIVNRDPKSVWNWLQYYKIPTRPRGHDISRLPKGRKSGFKQSEETKTKLRKIAIADGRVPYDPKVGSYMKGRKGSDTPAWKGGITPERQACYSSPEWSEAVKAVWKRDKATCQRCLSKKKNIRTIPFDIHHIVGFSNKELRTEPSNLVLLCEPCHYWVHSKKNTTNLFICRS